MANIELQGYTVIYLDTRLFPSVQDFSGDSSKHLRLNCKSMTSPDNTEGILTFDIDIEACLPDEKGSENHQPFLQTKAQFMFSFVPDETVSEKQLGQLITSTGVQMAVPIIRGTLAGVGNMLNHPEVYDFPSFKPDIIEWREESEE